MGEFPADWLALREPYDAAARSSEIARRLRAWRPPGPLGVVDLGGGTGANLRYLAPRLGGRQVWRIVDNDPDLLAAVPAHLRAWAAAHGFGCERRDGRIDIAGPGFEVAATTLRADLASELPVDGAALVTASALLDLVSAEWLDRLIGALSGAAAALFALSYDGRVAWAPALDGDARVTALVERHQHGDKGFGPALGPDAAGAADRRLRDAGFAVLAADSPWRLEPADRAIQRALLDGWVDAAGVLDPPRPGWLDAWAGERRRRIEAGGSALRVGHVDLLALRPPS